MSKAFPGAAQNIKGLLMVGFRRHKAHPGLASRGDNCLGIGASQPDDLIYEITKAVWNKNSRALLDAGHAKGKEIVLDHALDGVGIPLHPGAERFYREAGLGIPAAE